ncbi:MAG: hypothetical protein OMM_08352 [Candidatus Magnetoglobus multicellularis str. Araruama]|uniref:Uncharacterized protein n=1 Tax=Candidatus Magnetoglobus multicellularis str. Araruama TaxID=890399 RepID=A0A1V1P8A0_9BACT|nr:MAG: hypothetical protein OMM_08352 [Candidatus Magnetoglobus multicellularis str. Araruama]
MSHVLYYFIDPAVAIRSAMMINKPGGAILIIHQTQTGIPEIQHKIMKQIKGNTFELLTTETIAYHLNLNKIPYDYFEVDAHLNTTECIKKVKQVWLLCLFVWSAILGNWTT